MENLGSQVDIIGSRSWHVAGTGLWKGQWVCVFLKTLKTWWFENYSWKVYCIWFLFSTEIFEGYYWRKFPVFFFALSKFWFSKGWMQFGGSEPTNLDAIVLRMMELLWLWSEAVIFSILKNLLLAKQLCKVANVQEEFCVPLKNFLGVLFGWF